MHTIHHRTADTSSHNEAGCRVDELRELPRSLEPEDTFIPSVHIPSKIQSRAPSKIVTYPPNWPMKVSCEMNIEAWRSALKNAGLLPEYSDVLEGFERGFDQGIPDHVIQDQPFFTPSNHTSSLLVADKVKSNIDQEVDKRRMFGPFTHEEVSAVFPFYRSNPLGAVVNGDGKIRPINDLSYPRGIPNTPSVNSFVDKRLFSTTWDDFDRVATFFRSSKTYGS